MTLLPVLAFGRYGDVLMADRFLYIPSVGSRPAPGPYFIHTQAAGPYNGSHTTEILITWNIFSTTTAVLYGITSRVDIVSTDASLANYDLVIAPALLLVNEEQAARLKEYVKRGGYLVLTIRSAMKDEYNALLPSRQPGPLAELTGVEVEEYYALRDPIPVVGNWFTGLSRQWAERLKVIDEKRTSVAAHFGPANGWLDKQVAITVNSYGYGLVYYVGALRYMG